MLHGGKRTDADAKCEKGQRQTRMPVRYGQYSLTWGERAKKTKCHVKPWFEGRRDAGLRQTRDFLIRQHCRSAGRCQKSHRRMEGPAGRGGALVVAPSFHSLAWHAWLLPALALPRLGGRVRPFPDWAEAGTARH